MSGKRSHYAKARPRASWSGPVRVTRTDGTRTLEYAKRPAELAELANEDEQRAGGAMNEKRQG